MFLYFFGMTLLGMVFATFYSSVNKPETASAAGSCSISVSESGLSITARMSVSYTVTPSWQGVGDGGGWPSNIRVKNTNYSHTYSSYGSKTVTGSYKYTDFGSTVVKEMTCSKSFTLNSPPPPPNQQATAWVTNISCSAGGALTFTANVSDPDGGTPGYYLSIQNVGDTGWIYRSNGSYAMGAYYPPRDGVAYSISIWAVDAQTGGVVGPGVYYYSCPLPQPPIGVADACRLVAGNTVIYGWAYDTDSLTGPSINTNLGNVPDSNIANYRAAEINSYIGSNYGDGAKDNNYGWTLTVPGIYKGGTYSLSGTVINVGPGSNTGLGINTSVGPPAPLDASYYGFPSSQIPQECLPELNVPSCTLNSISAIEPGDTYQPQINVVYGAGGPDASVIATVSISINGVTTTRTSSPATTVAPGTNQNIDLPPPITFSAAGAYPVVTKSVSGTVSGVSFGPVNCGGATTVPVVAKPYFKVFNGGARVGAGFNSGTTTCSAVATGQVSGFASNSTGFLRGASTQYDLKALQSVATTFYSSGANSGGVPTFKSLTYANNAASGTYGGSFGGSSCITDYYSTTKLASTSTVPGGVTNTTALDAIAGANSQIEALSDMTLSGGNLLAGDRLVIYTTGNVYITSNITLSTNYTTVADIPFFALVVKGNIMIAPGVTTLDGLYIAQPNGSTGGTVYTCATSATSIPASTSLYNSCNTKLTFNGSVVAKSIKLLRTGGTLRSGPADETAMSANIAEVFNGMPELFIANPAFKIDDTANDLYDSVTSLPPLL